MSKTEESIDYLYWKHICGAVMDVYEENLAASGGIKANADAWVIHSELRRLVWERVRSKWVGRSQSPGVDFPYSEDGIARIYLRYRKRGPEKLAAFKATLEGE